MQVALALVVTAALAAAPIEGLAEPALHATRGVVRSFAATSLVVARGKGRNDITFALTPAVRCDGVLKVGAVVSVRYRDEGAVHVAVAVTVQRPAM